jgi:hypothetical protein
VKISLQFASLTNDLLDDVEKANYEWGEDNKWHNHNVRDIRVGFQIASHFIMLDFENIEELSTWLINFKKKFKNEKDKKKKLKFLMNTIKKYSSYNRLNIEDDEIPDEFNKNFSISFCITPEVSPRESTIYYQKQIFDDVKKNIKIPQRKRGFAGNDDDEDEDNDFSINSDERLLRSFQKQQEDLESENQDFYDTHKEGQGIIKIKNVCIKKFKSNFC